MIRKREIEKRRRWRRQDLIKAENEQRFLSRQRVLKNSLAKIVKIVAQPSFRSLVHEYGITSIPNILIESAQTQIPQKEEIDGGFADAVLDFAVAWKFLFPLFSAESIANYLESEFPGAIIEIKDTFIALVMYGPLTDNRRIDFAPERFR